MSAMKYKGSLASTIKRKRIGLLATEAAYTAEAKRITDEFFSKLPDLFKAHGVTEGNWLALSLALAEAHVPGFRVVNPAGRKARWGVSYESEFRLDVDILIEESKPKALSVVEAIKLVCRRESWIEKTKSMSLSALEKHYYSADLRWVQIVKDARAYEKIVENK